MTAVDFLTRELAAAKKRADRLYAAYTKMVLANKGRHERDAAWLKYEDADRPLQSLKRLLAKARRETK